MSGLVEPIVVGGKRIYLDEKTGIKITERVPVDERIGKVVKRDNGLAEIETPCQRPKENCRALLQSPYRQAEPGCQLPQIFSPV